MADATPEAPPEPHHIALILKRLDENWFECRPVDSSRVGLIPAPYVDPIVGEIDENARINRIDSELNLKIQELNELAMRL